MALSFARASVRVASCALRGSGAGLVGRVLGTAVVAAAGVTAGTLANLQISRSMERQADDRGVEICASAGYNPEAAAGAIAKLGGARSSTTRLLDGVTSTHPSTSEREQNLRKKARGQSRPTTPSR